METDKYMNSFCFGRIPPSSESQVFGKWNHMKGLRGKGGGALSHVTPGLFARRPVGAQLCTESVTGTPTANCAGSCLMLPVSSSFFSLFPFKQYLLTSRFLIN